MIPTYNQVVQLFECRLNRFAYSNLVCWTHVPSSSPGACYGRSFHVVWPICCGMVADFRSFPHLPIFRCTRRRELRENNVGFLCVESSV